MNNIQVERIVWGDEPRLETIDKLEGVELSKLFTWYNQFLTNDDRRKYIAKYLADQPDLLVKFNQMTDYGLINWVSAICRQKNLGAKLSPELIGILQHKIEELVVTHSKGTGDVKIAPSRQYSAIERNIEVLGRLESLLDKLFERNFRYFKPDIGKALEGLKVSEQAKKSALSFYGELLKYVEEDEDIGKNKEKRIAYARYIRDILNYFADEPKVIRAPRKKKVKTPGELVKKFKYLEKFNSFISAEPRKLIGASQAWLYNTKSNKLIQLVAKDTNIGLGVKGTTIIGFDDMKSQSKSVDNKNLNKVIEAGKVELRGLMGTFKRKATTPNGRSSESIIILRIL